MKNVKPFLILLLLLGGVFVLSGVSLAIDPNVNTQLTDLRSNGSNGNPGFDPCLGTRTAAGACSAGTGLLSSANLITLFPTLGPGAVTDNMFGIIATKNAAGNPMDTTKCSGVGANSATSSAALTNPNGFQPGLNCGDLHFDPNSQGQNALALLGNNTLTTNPVVMNFVLISDFCANAGTDCRDGAAVQQPGAHMGLVDVNNFTWTKINATSATSDSAQTVTQVTAVKQTGIGTRAVPGAGDQEFSVTNAFTTTSSNNAFIIGANTVTWTQAIHDPDQSGLGTTGKFDQVTSGSFITGDPTNGVFPLTQYPSGQTQTNGVQGAATNVP